METSLYRTRAFSTSGRRCSQPWQHRSVSPFTPDSPGHFAGPSASARLRDQRRAKPLNLGTIFTRLRERTSLVPDGIVTDRQCQNVLVTPVTPGERADPVQFLNHRRVSSSFAATLLQTDSSIQSQSMCPQRIWPSWMRAVSRDGIESTASATPAIAPPPSPVNATVKAPILRPASRARHTF